MGKPAYSKGQEKLAAPKKGPWSSSPRDQTQALFWAPPHSGKRRIFHSCQVRVDCSSLLQRKARVGAPSVCVWGAGWGVNYNGAGKVFDLEENTGFLSLNLSLCCFCFPACEVPSINKKSPLVGLGSWDDPEAISYSGCIQHAYDLLPVLSRQSRAMSNRGEGGLGGTLTIRDTPSPCETGQEKPRKLYANV